MSLDALRVALQGVGFSLSPVALAVQGFVEELIRKAEQDKLDAGRAGKTPVRDYLSENLIKQQKARDDYELAQYNLTLQEEDQLATDFIMALVQMEIIHG